MNHDTQEASAATIKQLLLKSPKIIADLIAIVVHYFWHDDVKIRTAPFIDTDILLSQDNHVGNFLYIVDSGDLNVDFSFIYCQKYKSYLKLNVLPNWNRIVFQSDKILVPKFHPKPPQEWRLQLRAQKSLNFLLLGRERPFYLLQWLEMLVMLELIFGFIC